MRRLLITTALALAVISALSVCGESADTTAVPNDPVEVVRAEETANLSGGNWRIYLSKRWQDVITPAIMNDLNYFYVTGPNGRLPSEQAKNPPKDNNRANTGIPVVSDVKLVEATDTTAVVEFSLSLTVSDQKRTHTYRTYLVKEGDRWVIDTIDPDMPPEWAIQADIKPIYDEIAPIVRQYFSAIYDDQGRARRDSARMEAFAKAYLSDKSMAHVGVKRYVRTNWPFDSLDKAARDKCLDSMQLLSPVVVTIGKVVTVGSIEDPNGVCAIYRSLSGRKGRDQFADRRQGFRLRR